MGIWDRFTTLFKSNINDLISRAENPEKMLDQIVLDMRNQLASAKQQVASAIADETIAIVCPLRRCACTRARASG